MIENNTEKFFGLIIDEKEIHYTPGGRSSKDFIGGGAVNKFSFKNKKKIIIIKQQKKKSMEKYTKVKIEFRI